jgi:hypothetical protein
MIRDDWERPRPAASIHAKGGKFCIVLYFRGSSRGERELSGAYGLERPAPSGVIDNRPGGISGPGTQFMS